MRHIPSTNTKARRARFIAWARLLLVWVGGLLFSDTPQRMSRRHRLTRYFYADLDRVAAEIGNIILLHVAAKLHIGKAKHFKVRNCAAPGFAHRTQTRSMLRAARGSWLRRRLRHRDLRTRFTLLCQALDNIEALAARVARRLVKRLTRLFGLRAIRPPHVAVRILAIAPIAAADSS